MWQGWPLWQVEANLPVLVEAVIQVAPDQEGVVMNNQMKLVYALDGYQRNVEDAHGRGQRTCLGSDAAELLPDLREMRQHQHL